MRFDAVYAGGNAPAPESMVPEYWPGAEMRPGASSGTAVGGWSPGAAAGDLMGVGAGGLDPGGGAGGRINLGEVHVGAARAGERTSAEVDAAGETAGDVGDAGGIDGDVAELRGGVRLGPLLRRALR